MNNEMMIFEDHEVEIFEFNGEVLFNPYHVGICLDISDVKSSMRNFNSNQVKKITNEDITNSVHSDLIHKIGKVFLTESGVYKLIFKSRKPEAEKFQDWVTDVVLPSIRKTGSYKINKPKQATISSSYKEASTIVQSYMKVGKLLGTAEPMAKAIAVEQTRRVTGVDFKELLPLANIQEIPVGIRDLAKKLNIKENKLKDILTREGLMTRADDENKTILLTEKAKSLKMGTLEPFQSKSSNHVGYQSKWFPSIVKDFIDSKYQEAA